MGTRRLLIALATGGALAAGAGTAVIPASAELRTLTVTLLGGQTMQVQVDVPAGTPLDEIQLPNLATPVVGISEQAPPADEEPAEEKDRAKDAGDKALADEAPKSQGAQRKQKTRRKPAEAVVEAEAQDLQQALTEDAGAEPDPEDPGRRSDGTPTLDNPGYTLALPGPAPIGVPNFFIDKFRIPPFLLPIYQAAGTQYGIRWEVLAAINEIETDYGRNLNVSSAGALGWMQFMPATWKAYGVDANQDGKKDPYNPVDAIFAAARYLRAAGAEQDLEKAIFAYNHADWYVDSVMMRARVIGGLPANLVGSLTGLTQAHFPVHAKARYADDISEREARRKVRKGQNAAFLVQASKERRGINIYARRGAPVVAVNDGKVVRMGVTKRLGRFIQLQDAFGNTFTYAHLGKVARSYPSPKPRTVTREEVREELDLAEPRKDPAPTEAASAGRQVADTATAAAQAADTSVRRAAKATGVAEKAAAPAAVASQKQRLFANPRRPRALRAGGEQQIFEAGGKVDGFTTFKAYFSRVFGLDRKDVELKRLRVGSKVVAGTILGRIGKTDERVAPHVLFEIRPAGRGAPRIDPKPILDGWKLLESTAIYRAAGKNPFFGPDAKTPSIGQILLMNKAALTERVLSNPRVEIYDCGRRDVQGSQIDRRVLATLEFLAASGMKPTVTSLKCGHSFYTKSGNVSHHSSGNAVDIAALNGIPVIGNQGKGSITEAAVQRLLTLQGTMKPDQIITLMRFEGADNTYAMSDHADHIHIGWRPMYDVNSKRGRQINAVLKPKQWIKLIDRLGEIDNPTVRLKPSKYALDVVKHAKKRRASEAHVGE